MTVMYVCFAKQKVLRQHIERLVDRLVKFQCDES